MAGLETRLFPYTRCIPVRFCPAPPSYAANLAPPAAPPSWTALAGAHATVARLVAAARHPRGISVRRGAAGVRVGSDVHRHLEHYFTHGTPPASEHRLSVTLRRELEPHLRGARVVPELRAAAPALGMATAIDAVACRGDHVFVIEYKTGYHGVFDTASAGRWRAAVAPALAAAGIKCTPGGCAAMQAFLGALAMHATFEVPLERMTVVVMRVWAGSAGPATAIRAYPLATPVYRAVADTLRRVLGRAPRKKRAPTVANVGRRRGRVRQ